MDVASPTMPDTRYWRTMAKLDKYVPSKLLFVWNHAAGPKTVFFWSPVVKGGVVLAGIGDLQRPAEKISIPQTAALACTGLIWSRNCVVIIPKNYALMVVNIFVAVTGFYQVGRGLKYQRDLKKQKESDHHPSEEAIIGARY